MSFAASALPDDPYAEPAPSFWRRHEGAIWALVVFLFTVGLTIVSFPPFKAGEFAYAFAVPAVLWAYRRPRFKVFAWTVLGAQAVAWTILLSWLHHVTWIGLFLLGPFIGVWVGLWYLAAWWVMPRMLGRKTGLRLLAMLGLAGVWVLLEWTRTWVLGGFPWLPLAASQWQQVSVLQVAAFTGAGGISFVVIAANIGFAAYAHRLFFERLRGINRRSQEFFLAMFLLIVCLSVHVQETVNRGHFLTPFGKVALVQPYIPQTVKWDPAQAQGIFETLALTTQRAALTFPDFIVWPEAVTPYAIQGNDGVRAWTEDLVSRVRVPLVMGSVAIENAGQPDERWTNSAFVVDPEVGLQSVSYAKRRLVPFGEFVPFRPLLGWLEKVTDVGEGDFHPGDSGLPLHLSGRTGGFALGVLICYEDIFPQLARENVLLGAEALVVLTNNGWFGEGGAAYQHASHSVLRAVETRRPVIRCGNSGWSGWIDEFGKIRGVMTDKRDSIYFRGSQTFEITRDSRWVERPSFYTQHGDWFVVFCLVLIGLGAGAIAFTPAPTPKADDDELERPRGLGLQ